MNNYLCDVLDLIDENAYRREAIADWESMYQKLLTATPPNDQAATYEAIESVLARLEDRHSHFIRPGDRRDYASVEAFNMHSRPHGQRLGADVGYIELFNLAPGVYEESYAATVHDLIREVMPLSKWVVDLRRNGGGNMYPMLAGIGPILGEGKFGGFVGRGSKRHICTYRAGAVLWEDEIIHQILQPVPAFDMNTTQVAVLCSSKTASAGENVLIAFMGRPNTRLFGEATAGLTIGNAVFPLADGAEMVLATAAAVDRRGMVYEGKVQPDVVISVNWAEYRNERDPVLQAALSWLV